MKDFTLDLDSPRHSIQRCTITPTDISTTRDAPAPWRIVNTSSELCTILDARGHTVFICRKEVAGRIIGAVNLVEGGHR